MTLFAALLFGDLDFREGMITAAQKEMLAMAA